jgi:hypothetical protein
MSAAAPATERYPRLQRLIQLLTYAYLVRFPLLTAAAMIVIPCAAFWTNARSLLENLFDLSPVAIMVVTITALLSAWSVMVTVRLTLTYSSERFGVVQPRVGPLGWRHILGYGLLAAPRTAGIVYETVALWDYTPHKTNLWKIAAFAPGIIIAFLLLWVADVVERRIDRAATNPKAPALLMPRRRPPAGKIIPLSSELAPEIKTPGWVAKRVLKISPYSGRGYIDYEGSGRFPLLPGHGGALALWLTFAAVYAALGVLTLPGLSPLRAPSLSGALLLLTMLNWALSGAAFFLDRYRIPVLISILIVSGIVSIFFPHADSYYFIHPKGAGEKVKPQSLLAPRSGGQRRRHSGRGLERARADRNRRGVPERRRLRRTQLRPLSPCDQRCFGRERRRDVFRKRLRQVRREGWRIAGQ